MASLTPIEKKELAAAGRVVARLSQKLQTPAKKPAPVTAVKKAGAVKKPAAQKGGAKK